LHFKEAIRKQYCITSKLLNVLEWRKGSDIFDCLSNYYVSSLPACYSTQINIILFANTTLHFKENFRERYRITSKQLNVLEWRRGSDIFDCLSNYHVSSLPACYSTQINIILFVSTPLHCKEYTRDGCSIIHK
jgi:hypothetical protein